jgi:hypothetical protein
MSPIITASQKHGRATASSVKPASSNRVAHSPNMGTEAIKSKDINGRRRPSRSTGYHFFLLA